MKIAYLFILFFGFLFQSSFSNGAEPLPTVGERRLESYHSPEEYLATFGERGRNERKPKILFVGAGLAYDDLVTGSMPHFIRGVELTKNRTKHYPSNAYLIDLDGKLFHFPQLATQYASHSDFQGNIAAEIGHGRVLPHIFIGQFDYIVLENLNYEAMTGKAFKNLFNLLKNGGKIISNVDFEVQIADIRSIEENDMRRGREHSVILDRYHNALLELCYPSHAAVEDEEESLLSEFIYTISPLSSKEDRHYLLLQEHHRDKVINLIPFEEFKRLYESDLSYKRFIDKEAKEIYESNLSKYFSVLLPHAHLSFIDTEALWCAPHPPLGFFVISKGQ